MSHSYSSIRVCPRQRSGQRIIQSRSSLERVTFVRYIDPTLDSRISIIGPQARRSPNRIQRFLFRRNDPSRLPLRRAKRHPTFLPGLSFRRRHPHRKLTPTLRSPLIHHRHRPHRRPSINNRAPRRLQKPTGRSSPPNPRTPTQKSRRSPRLPRRRPRIQRSRQHPRQHLARTDRHIDHGQRIPLHALHEPFRVDRHQRDANNVQESKTRRA